MNGAIGLWLTTFLFTLTYIALALGKVPGLRLDRAGIAMVGATLMLVSGMLTFEEAISPTSIDFKTLALLFGLMVVIGYLRLSGFFERLTSGALARIRGPHGLLVATVALSGVLSAFLINDIVCLALTPLVLRLARRLGFDPVPHLIALATAANIGSTGTITGNPQNIYIGSHSGVSYVRFAARLMPVAALGLVLDVIIVAFVYRRRLATSQTPLEGPADNQAAALEENNHEDDLPKRERRWLERKSVFVTLVTVILFFTGLPLELVALGAAALMLLWGRVKPDKIQAQIDWSLLVMFTGLFIVVHAFQMQVVSHWGIDNWSWLLQRPVDLLSVVSAALSNLVSNVPAVLLMEPIIHALPGATRETGWLSLAMSSTFAGNLTILGSVANLIVVEHAAREGATISFSEYCKVGIPLTLLTLGMGIAWLQFVHY